MANVIMLDAGRHNAALEESVERLNQSGQWKKQRVAYVIPGPSTIPARTYVAHRGLIFPPNQAMAPIYIEQAEVGAAYEEATKIILGNPTLREFEYVLTLEADNIPPVDGVLKLIKRMEERPEFACIGGLYWTKGEGGVPQIWGDVTDPVLNWRPQMPVPGELVECNGTGMGFNLWKTSFFRELEEKKMERPWFKTVASGTEGVGTQDLYFWGKARKYGARCAIDCDVLVGHLDTATGVIW
jgi:hypothetical protein